MSDAKVEARLALRVHPGARKNQVTAVTPELVAIRIAAPADKGKANAELVSFLAEVLGVAKSDIRIMRGDFSHHKLISVAGLSAEEAAARLGRVADKKAGTQGRLVGE